MIGAAQLREAWCALRSHPRVLAPWGSRTEQFATCACGRQRTWVNYADDQRRRTTRRRAEAADRFKERLIAAELPPPHE